MIDAFWASLDQERPSGDDPKRVASALSQFYRDLQKHLGEVATVRWRTPLFLELDPTIRSTLSQLQELTTDVERLLPTPPQETLSRLRALDESLREATFRLEEEERNSDLVAYDSPKLNQLNYLYQGWQRGFLESGVLKEFLRQYSRSVGETRRDMRAAEGRLNPRESDQEREAVEQALRSVDRLAALITRLLDTIPAGPKSCQPVVDEILALGQGLGEVFQTLERCAPLQDPCPFCGGEISLSGRCRRCTRRLPHLEDPEVTDSDFSSDFESLNCRALDLAYQRWESSRSDLELWRALQEAVREFSGHVTNGRKSLEMLSTAPDRPIDPDSEARRHEDRLKAVADTFQATVSLLSRFTQSPQPPEEVLTTDWRAPLKAAESELRVLEQASQPEPEE